MFYIPLFGIWLIEKNDKCPECHIYLDLNNCQKPKSHYRFKASGYCQVCKKHYWYAN